MTTGINTFSLFERPGIVIVNTEQVIVACNERAANLAGYEKEELINKHLDILVPVRFRQEHQRVFQNLANDTVYRAAVSIRFGKTKQLPMLRKDDSEIIVDISLQALVCTDKSVLILAFVEDSDEARKLVFEYLKKVTSEIVPIS